MTNWQKQFTFEHLKAAAACYGVPDPNISKVGGFENLIYKMEHNGETTIMRVTHDSHRTAKQVQAELNFVNHLAKHNINVCKPLPSPDGRLLEQLPYENGTFLLTAFEKARGGHVHGGHLQWRASLFREWGRITALMHACAVDYSVPKGEPDRMTVDEQTFILSPDPLCALSAEKQLLHPYFKKLEEQITRLPRNRDSYGLCHRDLHHGNFFVKDGVIFAFDFDDCGYDYFVQDIAMAVYYASTFPKWNAPVTSRETTSNLANRFLTCFMEGYDKVRSMDRFWMKQLPLFIEKRRSELCLILWDEWVDGTQDQREWLSWNLDGITNDQPCMEL